MVALRLKALLWWGRQSDFKLPPASWYTYQTFSVLRLGTCGEGVFYFLRYINYIIFSLSCQGKSSIFQRVGEANESRKIFIIHISKEAFQTSFFNFQVPYLFRYIYYIKEILFHQEKSLSFVSKEHDFRLSKRFSCFSKSVNIG